jgi:hypothetical protein
MPVKVRRRGVNSRDSAYIVCLGDQLLDVRVFALHVGSAVLRALRGRDHEQR